MTGASAGSIACPPPDPNPRTPRYKAPANACDCHAHVIGPAARYPFVFDRSYTPPDALLSDYLHMLRVIGIQRSVLVQPSMHGTDNTVMMNAIAATAGIDMRAVVVVPSDVTDAELSALHQGGARGVRLNMIYSGGGVGLGEARMLAERIKSFGWHLQVLIDVTTIGDASIFALAALPVPLVVDHMGHFDARKGKEDKGFQALLDLMERVQQAHGGSRRLGARLPEMLTEAGWSIQGERRSAPPPQAAAQALPQVFLPVARFYLERAGREGIVSPDAASAQLAELQAAVEAGFRGAEMPLFHAWAVPRA